ncbi:MAG: 1,4-dihydroxy-2-naphthoate octaprenyltransferase [Verrucomicrobia bacterium]|nr:1,4-dihydroxy-2-naphthoate octaprenyltransferase [Verrucomicrobiota bacterium]
MKPFIIALRPKTLIAALSPICIGSVMAYAHGSFHLWVLIFTLLTGLGIQISTNMINDLFDHLKGADTPSRKGPVRVTASGLLNVIQMKRMTLAMMTFTTLCGSALIFRGGWIISILVSLALVCAFAYTAGPFALAYLGIGEFFVLIFFGPVATMSTYFLQTLAWNPEAAVAGIAPGLISCAILVINNLRDVEEDRKAGRKNLICRFGPQFGKWEFATLIFAAMLVPFWFHEKHLLILLSTLWIIPASFLVNAVAKNHDPYAYTPLFGKTGKLLLVYTIIFSVGYLL